MGLWNTLSLGEEFSTKLEIKRLKKKIIKNQLKLNILKRNLKELENKKANKKGQSIN
jgi:hypothetical protein